MSVGYVLKEGLAGLGRARLAALTSIFSLFIAVLLIGVLFRLGYNAYEVTQMLNQQVEVEVFLDDLNSTDTQLMEGRLMENPGVTGLSYISKDSAAAIFQQEFGSGGSSLADLKFLPASFRLSISPETDVTTVDSLVREIQGYRGVDEVRFNQQLLQLLQNRFQTVATVGGGLGFLILLAALILVFNTIRLTIYAKRGLIKAMKLVGATNSFIRRPFVVEGLIQGFIAGLLSVGVMYMIFQFVVPEYVGILEWPFGRWYYLCGGMMLLSLVMGFWGSQWAARRFIKETSITE